MNDNDNKDYYFGPKFVTDGKTNIYLTQSPGRVVFFFVLCHLLPFYPLGLRGGGDKGGWCERADQLPVLTRILSAVTRILSILTRILWVLT